MGKKRSCHRYGTAEPSPSTLNTPLVAQMEKKETARPSIIPTKLESKEESTNVQDTPYPALNDMKATVIKLEKELASTMKTIYTTITKAVDEGFSHKLQSTIDERAKESFKKQIK